MKSLVFAGIAATALTAAGMPVSASDSFDMAGTDAAAASLKVTANGTNSGRTTGGRSYGSRGGGHFVGTKPHGSRFQGPRFQGPRGGTQIIRTGGFQRPFIGFALPRYWSAPSFYITNYSNFGLSRPQNGYSWSRYFDDAVLRDGRGQVHDVRENIDWSRGGAGYAPNGYYQQQPQPQQGPTLNADQNAFGWGEESYSSSDAQATTERGVYDGEWTGAYIDPENRVYRGEWTGKYINDEGQVYEGTYRGTATGDPVYSTASNQAGAPFPQQQPNFDQNVDLDDSEAAAWGQPAPSQTAGRLPNRGPFYNQTPAGFQQYERCLKGRGLTGGAIGTIIGAIAGNRIAGRGNRLIGSLFGGGIGAISGALIEKAVNKCEKYLPSQQAQPSYPQGYPQQQYPQATYPSHSQAPAGYGWSNGYYWVPGGYYYPPATTTVTIIPGSVTTTTTTTTEFEEEASYASSGKRLMKPAGKRLIKPSCKC